MQQAAETRALVLSAATSLFGARGWSATGMRDIAKEAGVSVETVYANFASKAELLLAAIDAGVVGDAEPVPISERPGVAALGVGTVSERVAQAARLLTGINQRTKGLHRALGEAAASEPQLATQRDALEGWRRDNIRDGVQMIAGRQVEDDVLDALWAVLGVDTFCLLTDVRGRTVEDYERWVSATILRLLGVDPT